MADIVACGGIEHSTKRNGTCPKRQKLSDFPSELSASGSDLHFLKKKAQRNGDKCGKSNGFKFKINANALKTEANANRLEENSCISGKRESGWIFIRATSSETNSCSQSKRPSTSQDIKDEFMMENYDPFAFDEGELELSKWEKLAGKKESTETVQSTVTNKHSEDYDNFTVAADSILSQSTDGANHKSLEDDCLAEVQDDCSLLEDCLLASVKVFYCPYCSSDAILQPCNI